MISIYHKEFEMRRLPIVLLCAGALLFAKGEAKTYNTLAKNIPQVHPGILAGYLNPKQLPDSLKLIHEAPVPGSAAQQYDDAVSHAYLTLQGTKRWKLAAKDADLSFPNAAKIFTCALGVPIDRAHTPHLYLLLQRTLADAGLSTYGAKNHYQRLRPFMLNKQPVCTPNEEKALRKDGSYPSGHTAIGWAWALILAEIAPERADAILARGRAYGESRIVCNVHWHSDVEEGRFMGASAVAKLHSNPQFMADLEAAKKEVAALRAKGAKPNSDCTFEREALAIKPKENFTPGQ